jgi:Rrf2 family protein
LPAIHRQGKHLAARMIRISKKADYAVFLMGYIAERAPCGSAQVVSAAEIAAAIKLGQAVVANLLKDLARDGLLESVRGARGGYRLALEPQAITLERILRVVEGPFLLVDCTHDLAGVPPEDHDCSLFAFCSSKRPMRVLHQRIRLLMQAITLDELIRSPFPPTSLEKQQTAGLP